MSDLPLGSLIDAMQANREERRLLESELKELKSTYDGMERAVIAQLDALNIGNARGSKGSASLKESIVPNVKDPDLFMKYIQENEAWYLLTGAPSTPACREIFQSGETIPGVEPFCKRTLNLRTTN